jgi:hypothetical protein
MTNGDFMKIVTNDLKAYVKQGPSESVRRNHHMNEWEGDIPSDLSDALLVDFVNYIASRRGMDYGLYTRDLKE